ncbi:MAG: BPL-N domain-containing protein [Sandaracinaceae bacterium]
MKRRFAVCVGLALFLAPVAGAQPEALSVVIFDARGVGPRALDTAMEAYGSARGIRARRITPEDVRAGVLDEADAVLFTGGRGSVQGRLLGDEGRARVRRFVAGGGGYVGICAGSYLALQGAPEFHKIALIAGEHATGDRWRRGVRPTRVQANDGSPDYALHYANGPLFARRQVPGLAPFVVLATFDADVHWAEYGTLPGEMPGTPAVVAAQNGQGRLVLFSPNPTLEPAHPEHLVRATRWAARGGAVPDSLRWRDVFGP